MIELLNKMCLSAVLEDDKLRVTVPITRSDILHACDVVEDVGIAYGFNNLPIAPPPTICLGKQNELNRISDKVREGEGEWSDFFFFFFFFFFQLLT